MHGGTGVPPSFLAKNYPPHNQDKVKLIYYRLSRRRPTRYKYIALPSPMSSLRRQSLLDKRGLSALPRSAQIDGRKRFNHLFELRCHVTIEIFHKNLQVLGGYAKNDTLSHHKIQTYLYKMYKYVLKYWQDSAYPTPSNANTATPPITKTRHNVTRVHDKWVHDKLQVFKGNYILGL